MGPGHSEKASQDITSDCPEAQMATWMMFPTCFGGSLPSRAVSKAYKLVLLTSLIDHQSDPTGVIVHSPT